LKPCRGSCGSGNYINGAVAVPDTDDNVIRLSGKPFDGGSGTVKRVYIIVHEPNRIPDKKIPVQSQDGVTEFLLALELCRPKGTTYTVVELVWTGDIWVTSGASWLSEHKLMARRSYYALKRKAKAEHDRLSAAH